MSNRCTRTLSMVAAAFFLLPGELPAGDISLLRGQLQSESQMFFENLYVAMEEVSNHTQVHRADVSHEGHFEFRAVPPGDYVLRVTDLEGNAIYQEHLSIHEHMPDLMIHLPEFQRRPSPPGTVSFRQLRHPPSRKAVQAFSTASQLASSGQYVEAVTELEKAIRISPEFAAAYANLAVQQMRLRRYEEGAASAERAIEIAGPDPLNLCNLAYAQLQLHRVDAAAANARAALRLDSGYLPGHLILGSALAFDPAARAEAIRHLELAAGEFPSARATLEQLRSNR